TGGRQAERRTEAFEGKTQRQAALGRKACRATPFRRTRRERFGKYWIGESCQTIVGARPRPPRRGGRSCARGGGGGWSRRRGGAGWWWVRRGRRAWWRWTRRWRPTIGHHAQA